MGGIDRANRAQFLMGLGWKEIENGTFVPPEELWRNRPQGFDIQDAITLQEILNNPDPAPAASERTKP